jgi:hypothetical protein
MEQPRIDLNQQQIQMAATAGVTLLNTPGAVKVDGPMATSGVIRTLLQLLMAIANNEVLVVNTPVKLADAPPADEPPKDPPKDPPNEKVAEAVAAAVESSGNSEEAPADEVVEK